MLETTVSSLLHIFYDSEESDHATIWRVCLSYQWLCLIMQVMNGERDTKFKLKLTINSIFKKEFLQRKLKKRKNIFEIVSAHNVYYVF